MCQSVADTPSVNLTHPITMLLAGDKSDIKLSTDMKGYMLITLAFSVRRLALDGIATYHPYHYHT